MVIELNEVQFGLKLYTWFQNRTNAQREFDLNSEYDFRPKLHDTRFNYHFFTSILKFPKYRTWSGQKIKFIRFLEGKIQSFGNNSCKMPHDTFCFPFSCNLIGYFKQALKSDWLFCFSVASSLAGKKMRFKAKNGAIRE